jgi:uncharacterized membrane protein
VSKGRLEAFSDGVLAIIITIMVLEMKVPHEASWAALRELSHVLVPYALSYVFIGIYWSNHHHLLQAVKHVSGGVLWANLHLLFWLSLVPFGTRWIAESEYGSTAIAAYGVMLLCSGLAYYILVQLLVGLHGKESPFGRAVGSDVKGLASIGLYGVAIPFALYLPLISYAIYVLVAIMWLVPDKRMERAMRESKG